MTLLAERQKQHVKYPGKSQHIEKFSQEDL